MGEESFPVAEEKFEDYPLEILEVKKRITEEKIQERMEFSIPNRIKKKYGIDIYKVAKYLLVIEIIILIIGLLIFLSPIINNPSSYENQEDTIGFVSNLLGFLMIMFYVIMPTVMFIFFDPTTPLKRKLREINRVIRIKQEISQGDIFDLDESESREYKSSFKYDYKTNNPNPNLSKIIVQSVLGFLNSNGGTLVIGISDDKTILGIKNDIKLFNGSWDKYQLAIQDALRKYTDTPLSDFIRIKKIDKEGKQICIIKVNQSPKPVYFIDEDKQELYIRDGNSTIKLQTKQAYDYITSHWIDKTK